MCPEEPESGMMVADCRADSQRTDPAPTLSLCPEGLVSRDNGVKTMISEGASDGFTGQPEEPTQIILSI